MDINNHSDAAAQNAVRDKAVRNVTGENRKSRKRAKNMWNVLTAARNQFNKQFHKSNELKFEILDSIVRANCADYQKFWLEYFKSAEILLDSKKFCEKCTQMHINDFILATHLVFQGKVAVDQVLTEGIEKAVGQNLNLYSDHFLNKDVLALRSSPVFGLLAEKNPVGKEFPTVVPVANPVNE